MCCLSSHVTIYAHECNSFTTRKYQINTVFRIINNETEATGKIVIVR